MAEDAASRLPEDRQNFAARRQTQPVTQIKDRVRTVHPGEDIVAGVRVLDTSGHTAGHIAIELVSEHQALLVVGDALTHPVISFDTSGVEAGLGPSRRRPGGRNPQAACSIALATDRTPIIGYHLPFPGIGRVERKGTAYSLVQGRG